jgi:hypothetical protein
VDLCVNAAVDEMLPALRELVEADSFSTDRAGVRRCIEVFMAMAATCWASAHTRKVST